MSILYVLHIYIRTCYLSVDIGPYFKVILGFMIHVSSLIYVFAS